MAELGVGREVHLRAGPALIETVDTIRLGHVVEFAHATGKQWPALKHLAAHAGKEPVEIEPDVLIEEMQRLALERPPENLAPIIGLIRNDATRARNIAQTLAGA